MHTAFCFAGYGRASGRDWPPDLLGGHPPCGGPRPCRAGIGLAEDLAEVRPEHEQDRLAPPFVHAAARLIGRALHELPVDIADPVERAERAAHPRLAKPELAVLVERPAIDREGELDPPGGAPIARQKHRQRERRLPIAEAAQRRREPILRRLRQRVAAAPGRRRMEGAPDLALLHERRPVTRERELRLRRRDWAARLRV